MTSSYTLPEGLFYLDTVGAQQYASTVTDAEIVASHTLDVPTTVALDAWFTYVWFTGAEEVSPGEGRSRGHVNHTRLMTKQGIEEKIVAAGVPSKTDARGAVASVTYTITNPGAMPIAKYLAFVRFVPTDNGKKTEIVWTIKISAAGKTKTASLVPIIQKTIGGGLKKFAKAVNGAAAAARAKL